MLFVLLFFFLVLLLKDSAKRENKFVSFVLRTISI